MGAGGAGGSRGEQRGLGQPCCTQPGCQARRHSPLGRTEEVGARSDARAGARQDKAGGEFACRGKSSPGSCQDQDPSTGAPSQPHRHHAMCPCPPLALSSLGTWGCWGTPGCPAGRGPAEMGCKEQQCAGSGPAGGRSQGRGQHPPLSGVPRPAARRGETPSPPRPLPNIHPSPRRPYLPLMLRRSLPKAYGLGKMLPDCICSKWILSGGEQSTGEFSKQSRDRSPRDRQTVPSSSTSLGTRPPNPPGSGLVSLGCPPTAPALPSHGGSRAGAVQRVPARRQQLHFHQKLSCCKIWPHSSCK